MESHQVCQEGLPTAPFDPFVSVAEAQALAGRAIDELQQRVRDLTILQQRQLELQQQLANLQSIPAPQPLSKPPKVDTRNLPTFTGTIGKSNVDKFIDGLERTFKAFDLKDDRRKVYYAVNQLRETASNWWFSLRIQRGTAADIWEATLTWTDFKELLQKQFKPTDFGQQLRDRLVALRQTTSVDSYTNTFQDIVSQLPSMSEDDRIYFYIKGLKPNTAAHVRAAQLVTLQEAIDKAATYDHAVFQRGSRRPASFPRRNLPPQQQQSADRMDIDNVNVRTAQPQNQGRTVVCYKCQKPGHIARNCQSRQRQQGNASRQ
jgi:Ty3 transposon capsid-like protein/Zinc knuckle